MCFLQTLSVTVFIICCCIFNSLPFNLDTVNPMIFHPGKEGYFFGYSLALHKHKHKTWLLVGAPRGNETSRGYKPRFGAVYKCDVKSQPEQCSLFRGFDWQTPEDTQEGRGSNDFYNSGQWMGGTVRSKLNYIMACAPRHVWPGKKKPTVYYPGGKCEIVDSDDFSRRWRWEPCKVDDKDKEAVFGYCGFGTDADFNSQATAVIGSGPILSSSKGRLMTAKLFSSYTKFSPNNGLQSGDQTGYSTVFGKLTSTGEEVLIAGAPTADLSRGQVRIYTTGYRFISVSLIITNPAKQIGSFFGSSLAVADVNGDGYQDLLVGAPYHIDREENGIVFVYINNQRENFDLSPTFLKGESDFRARFGLAIAAAGDLNDDGFEDIAIGAPNGGSDGRGVVYIYQGAKNGLENRFSQKITPSQFGLAGLSMLAFGSSLSGGVDIDDNGYPDLAVGSFLSDNAVILRSRPVATLEGDIYLQYAQINPNSTKHLCIGPDGTRRLCLPTWICINVRGKGVPLPIDIRYEYVIDEDERFQKRGIFLHKSTPSYRIFRTFRLHKRGCSKHVAYMEKQPKNIDDPLVFKVYFSYDAPTGCKLCPTMKPTSTEALASYAKNCGQDSICDADIKINANVRLPDGYKAVHIGVTKTMVLAIHLKNYGENAFLTQVSVLFPAQLSVTGVHLLQNTLVNWKGKYFNKTHTVLEFMAGNPVGTMEEEHFDIRFAVETIPTAIRRFHLEVNATTSSRDLKNADNKVFASVDVLIIADMTISGLATPEQVTYNESKSAQEIGPYIQHFFLIQNKGPSTVERTKVQIHFPEKFGDDYILNLVSLEVEGSVNCHVNKSSYNPLKLKIDSIHDAKRKLNRRKRRSVTNKLDCTMGKCQILRCELGRLRHSESVSIGLTSTLVEATFSKIIKKDIKVAVLAEIMPEDIRQPLLHFPDSCEPTLMVMTPKFHTDNEQMVPWWIVLISVIAGLVLVAGIVFVLYKLSSFNPYSKEATSGFFRRKKRDYSFSSVSDEAQD